MKKRARKVLKRFDDKAVRLKDLVGRLYINARCAREKIRKRKSDK